MMRRLRRWVTGRIARQRLLQDMTTCFLHADRDCLEGMITSGRADRSDIAVYALSCCRAGLRLLGEIPKRDYVVQPVTPDGSPVPVSGLVLAAALNDDAEMVGAHLSVIFADGEDSELAVRVTDDLIGCAGHILRRVANA